MALSTLAKGVRLSGPKSSAPDSGSSSPSSSMSCARANGASAAADEARRRMASIGSTVARALDVVSVNEDNETKRDEAIAHRLGGSLQWLDWWPAWQW